MAKYGKKAGEKVADALHERKAGTLKSGSNGRKVTSRRQAIAIGLSEARREGGKVPPARKAAAADRKHAVAKKRATGSARSAGGKAVQKKPTHKRAPKKRAPKKRAARKRATGDNAMHGNALPRNAGKAGPGPVAAGRN